MRKQLGWEANSAGRRWWRRVLFFSCTPLVRGRIVAAAVVVVVAAAVLPLPLLQLLPLLLLR